MSQYSYGANMCRFCRQNLMCYARTPCSAPGAARRHGRASRSCTTKSALAMALDKTGVTSFLTFSPPRSEFTQIHSELMLTWPKYVDDHSQSISIFIILLQWSCSDSKFKEANKCQYIYIYCLCNLIRDAAWWRYHVKSTIGSRREVNSSPTLLAGYLINLRSPYKSLKEKNQILANHGLL